MTNLAKIIIVWLSVLTILILLLISASMWNEREWEYQDKQNQLIVDELEELRDSIK